MKTGFLKRLGLTSRDVPAAVTEETALVNGLQFANVEVTQEDVTRRISRERQTVAARSERGAKPRQRKGDRKEAVTVRVTKLWDARLRAYCAENNNATMTAVIERAVTEWLDDQGFRKTPRG